MYAGGQQAKVCWPLFFVCRMAAAIAHLARTAVFFKNMRLSTPERAFFSKTCDCQPPNDCFSQKRAIVNPRTGRRNDVIVHIDPRIACYNDVTAHIDPRIACCKAQQLILTPESIVARRNSSY